MNLRVKRRRLNSYRKNYFYLQNILAMHSKNLLYALLLFCLVFSQQCFAQTLTNSATPPKGSVAGKLVINGSAQELQAKLKNVLVILYQDNDKTGNWVEVERQLSKPDGKFTFQLNLNSKYMIELVKEGYTTKKVEFDTEVYQLTNQPAPFDFIVDMVPDRDGLKYLNPVAKVFYYAKKKEFDYQLDYSKEQMEQDAKAEQEKLKKEAEERAKQEGKEIEK
ncbi:MAG: hypothetical protein POELPBGB_00512 [Bacteroidia bacterium]|nr:hypothetical protein [Bacteroidia bacterium]